jgi:hypothetical protein
MFELAWVAFGRGSSNTRKSMCRKDNRNEAEQKKKIPSSGITVAFTLAGVQRPMAPLGTARLGALHPYLI